MQDTCEHMGEKVQKDNKYGGVWEAMMKGRQTCITSLSNWVIRFIQLTAKKPV